MTRPTTWRRIDIDLDRTAKAKLILETAVKATGLFMFRKEAEDLLAQFTDTPVEPKKPAAPTETKKSAAPGK